MDNNDPHAITRRGFLGTTTAAAVAGTAGLSPWGQLLAASQPHDGQMRQLDATNPDGIDLVIERMGKLIDGKPGYPIAINGTVPGPVIRMQEGKEALIRVHNRLSESTSIHWHGLLLPFTMDGVPGISFKGIAAGTTFTYRFKVRQNGTYWYHSHSGLQEQLGHYGQLIITPSEPDPVKFDVEHTVVLSDWIYEDPHAVMRNLKTIEGYYNYQRPTLANLNEQMEQQGKSLSEVIDSRLAWRRMRMDPTDIADITGVAYTYLMNGRSARQNWTAIAKPGQRVRLRIVNASAMTYYDFRIPGLPMSVVQADGQNIKPVETDELRIAVAETYDVVVTMPDNRAYTLFAETTDRSGYARGTLAPRVGMSADVPVRRPRPLLTMADMGMVHGSGQMDGGHGSGHGEMSDTSKPATGDHSGHGPEHAPKQAQDDAQHAGHTQPMNHSGHGTALPITNLPERIMHGPDNHGPGSIRMAMSAYRQFDDPGPGLGKDGRRVLTYGQLRCLKTPDDRKPPTREFNLHLTGNMNKYIWGFDGKKWSEADEIKFQYGERLRINMMNDTMMSHPIHLHGMWMDLYNGTDYADLPRKHTVDVQPAELLTVDITVDAPGKWAFHCHLMYHMKMGMFRTIAVVRSLDTEAKHDHS